jgi:hypothetical protein
MLDTPKQYRKKPVVSTVAMVMGKPYHCTNPQSAEVIASPGEYVVNPGSQDEYPITRERLAELYEPVEE